MNRRTSERCALAALIALVIYGLACMYPAAWSPDSEKVIFPVFEVGKDGGIKQLVITDLSGKPVREVARVDTNSAALSSAAWSPDGKWIAYMRFEARPEKPGEEAPGLSKAKGFSSRLIIQNADSREEKCVFVMRAGKFKHDDALPEGSLLYGPRWMSDSRTLVVSKMWEGPPAILWIDLEGEVKREIPLEEGLPALTAAPSPDGRYVAYLKEVPEDEQKRWGLYVHEVEEKQAKQVATIDCAEKYKDSEILYPPPVWGADPLSLYLAATEENPQGKDFGVLERIILESGKGTTVWKKEEVAIVGISVSAKTGRLAIEYVQGDDDLFGIDVLDPERGKAIPVHFSKGAPHYSTSISPDGKWVALCPGLKEPEVYVGAVTSSDGGRWSFFVPDPEARVAIPGIVRMRLEGAVEAAVFKEGLKAAGVEMPPKMTANDLQKALEWLSREREKQEAPIFKEAAAYAKVILYLAWLGEQPFEQRGGLAAEARKHIADFLKAYPDHPVGPALEKQLAESVARKPGTAGEAPQEKK